MLAGWVVILHLIIIIIITYITYADTSTPAGQGQVKVLAGMFHLGISDDPNIYKSKHLGDDSSRFPDSI